MPGPGQGNVMMGLRQLLGVVDAVHQRVMPGLAEAGLQQMQDYLSIFGIVLIPGVVHRLAGPRQRQGGDETQLEAMAVEKIRQRPMIVAGGLEADQRRRASAAHILSQTLVVFGAIIHAETASPSRSGRRPEHRDAPWRCRSLPA